jgi:hypothetical protein
MFNVSEEQGDEEKEKRILRLPNNTRIKLLRKQTKIKKRNLEAESVEGAGEEFEKEKKEK